ncbi:MAG: hypothetical protein LBG83_00960 [Oscillospiraceae bacterium]|jgi:hypothetical protein|nr:hypothetical protein [Oscillospiraceae bacterium]
MTELRFGGWRIACDPAATRRAYATMADDKRCDCQTCRNYQSAAAGFPEEVLRFFEQLGVDVRYPTEVWDCGEENFADHLDYGGFYHLAGRNLTPGTVDPGAWVQSQPKRWRLFLRRLWKSAFETALAAAPAHVQLHENFAVAFRNDATMQPCIDLEDLPVLEVDIMFRVPWVLEEPYAGAARKGQPDGSP